MAGYSGAWAPLQIDKHGCCKDVKASTETIVVKTDGVSATTGPDDVADGAKACLSFPARGCAKAYL